MGLPEVQCRTELPEQPEEEAHTMTVTSTALPALALRSIHGQSYGKAEWGVT